MKMLQPQHLFLINQHVDLGVKIRAIDMYYKLKGKYTDLNNNSEANEVLEQAIQHIRRILPE